MIDSCQVIWERSSECLAGKKIFSREATTTKNERNFVFMKRSKRNIGENMTFVFNLKFIIISIITSRTSNVCVHWHWVYPNWKVYFFFLLVLMNKQFQREEHETKQQRYKKKVSISFSEICCCDNLFGSSSESLSMSFLQIDQRIHNIIFLVKKPFSCHFPQVIQIYKYIDVENLQLLCVCVRLYVRNQHIDETT